MTIATLVANARLDLLDDSVAPYLWSDAQLTRYANEAILQACKRAPLLNRVKTLAVTGAIADYTIDPVIWQINTTQLALVTRPLIQTTDAELNQFYSTRWRTRTGTPRHYLRTGHKITLVPIPLVADTLTITASCLPDDDFDLDDDIDSAYHDQLGYYIAYKAYMLPDTDTYNPVKAADFLVMFDAAFGPGRSAKYAAVMQDNPMYGTVISGRMC